MLRMLNLGESVNVSVPSALVCCSIAGQLPQIQLYFTACRAMRQCLYLSLILRKAQINVSSVGAG